MNADDLDLIKYLEKELRMTEKCAFSCMEKEDFSTCKIFLKDKKILKEILKIVIDHNQKKAGP